MKRNYLHVRFVIKEGLILELDTIAKECGFDSWEQLLFENLYDSDIYEIFCEYIRDNIDDYVDMFLDYVKETYERHDLVNKYKED